MWYVLAPLKAKKKLSMLEKREYMPEIRFVINTANILFFLMLIKG